jgi:DNA-binding CsgD family transcriptional regulator
MSSLIEQGFKFVERCSLDTASACADDFMATMRLFGFSASACGAWAGIGARRKHRFFFLEWPQDWTEFYETNQFFQHDLLPIEARRRTTPFWYTDVIEHFKLSEMQVKLHNGFLAYGWKDAFAVPIHGPSSVQGLVTIATRETVSFNTKDCAILEMMARALWERCRTSENFGIFDPGRAQLTPREIECLQWAAAGKSDTDIAVLIGVKPTTVHFHIERAKKRLGVKTRVEAVAVGVLHGVI